MNAPRGGAGGLANSPQEYLRRAGYTVVEQDIPGLYRINGGPEITYGQLLQLAREEIMPDPPTTPARAGEE